MCLRVSVATRPGNGDCARAAVCMAKSGPNQFGTVPPVKEAHDDDLGRAAVGQPAGCRHRSFPGFGRPSCGEVARPTSRQATVGGMKDQDTWQRCLRRAIVESCVPTRNWRWMLASLGIGAGFGLVGALHRLGSEPARLTPDAAVSTARAAFVLLMVVWLVVVAIRFGRHLRACRRVSRGTPF
jgi:hypothetical protein